MRRENACKSLNDTALRPARIWAYSPGRPKCPNLDFLD